MEQKVNNFFTFINGIPVDRYQHVIASVIIFAALIHFTTLPIAFGVSVGFHVVKKIVNYLQGSRHWSDLIQDVLYGVAGSVLSAGIVLLK
jgi:hypothetical protein